MADVEAAVNAGAAAALDVVEAISALKKPVHFHLHDGHPLSTVSPFGVSDHLGFQAEIPLNFEYRGRRAVAPMFGPEGLAKVVSRAVRVHGGHAVCSFTLEIHPTFERLPLGDAAPLFGALDRQNERRENESLAGSAHPEPCNYCSTRSQAAEP